MPVATPQLRAQTLDQIAEDHCNTWMAAVEKHGLWHNVSQTFHERFQEARSRASLAWHEATIYKVS